MRCVYAEWEERNLGCRTIELTIEKKDTLLPMEKVLQKIEHCICEYQAQYIVVRSNTKYHRIGQYLQTQGFFLMEAQVGLKLERENVIDTYEKYRDLFPNVTYRSASENDLEYVVSEIQKGIFETDRISLDPYFGKTVANRRYAIWTEDTYRRGGNLFISFYREKPMGFFLDLYEDEKKKKIKGLLGGLFLNENHQHCGSMHIFVGRMSFLDRELLMEKTSVSTNNLSILQLQLMFGSKIVSIDNVYIKHINTFIEKTE